MFSRKGAKEIKDKEKQDKEMKEREKPNNESFFFPFFCKILGKGEALVRVNSRPQHLPGTLSQSCDHTSLQKVPGSQSIQPSSRKK